MLKLFNDLRPFFEDSYRRINVREYGRIRKISPPSASTLLNSLNKEGLLNREEERNFIYFTANKENSLFIALSRAYWCIRFEKIGLISHIKQRTVNPLIILFGSFSKAEIKSDSDIDMAIFTPSKKPLNYTHVVIWEDMLKHKMQLFAFKNREEIKNKELLNNILNGFTVSGSW